jgi:hypothetical protein
MRRWLFRNPYRRTTLKALAVRMPLRWWRSWARLLWKTRQHPRLRRAGWIAHMYRHAYAQSLIVAVDAARRLRRFGSREEATRAQVRSFNARLRLNSIGAQERIAQLQQQLAEVG